MHFVNFKQSVDKKKIINTKIVIFNHEFYLNSLFFNLYLYLYRKYNYL